MCHGSLWGSQISWVCCVFREKKQVNRRFLRYTHTRMDKSALQKLRRKTQFWPSTKRLDTFTPSVLSGPADDAQHCQCQRQTAHPWCGMQREKTNSPRAVSSAKTIPVFLLARGCARRRRPLPGFCTFLLSWPFSPLSPPWFLPLSHRTNIIGLVNGMWRVFAGTEGAGIGSWEEIWKLPFAKCLQAMNQQSGGIAIKKITRLFYLCKIRDARHVIRQLNAVNS